MIPPPEAEAIARFRKDLATLSDPLPDGEDLVAVAVSGGPDSLALLLLARAALPGRVVAATVDHGLRLESAAEARFAAELCCRLDVPHAILPVTVADDPAGPQAAARRARYDALESWALASGARALLLGHHLDDQAETIIMRLGRGSGLSGLRGIRPRRIMWHGLALIRPLLTWRRAELAGIVEAAGLTAVDDPSNRNPRYDRTRARQLLADTWLEPARLAAVAAHATDAEDALTFSTRQLAADRLLTGDDEITLRVDGLPREYRRRLTLMALKSFIGNKDLRGDEVDRLLDRLAAGTVSTLAGIRVAPGPVWRFTRAAPHRSV